MILPEAAAARGLSQFLAEEVRDIAYADLLLERAEATTKGMKAPIASGDAYSVTFTPQEIVVMHHHLPDWPAVPLRPADFITALQSWRERLRGAEILPPKS
jgi:hypothetical protein